MGTLRKHWTKYYRENGGSKMKASFIMYKIMLRKYHVYFLSRLCATIPMLWRVTNSAWNSWNRWATSFSRPGKQVSGTHETNKAQSHKTNKYISTLSLPFFLHKVVIFRIMNITKLKMACRQCGCCVSGNGWLWQCRAVSYGAPSNCQAAWQQSWGGPSLQQSREVGNTQVLS